MAQISRILPEEINFEGMKYAPDGELGVVFLFSKMHRSLGFNTIVRLGDSFPDCEALMRIGKGKARSVQIEFEFRSRNFLPQHKAKGLRKVDFIICWHDNWPVKKRKLLQKNHVRIIELRNKFGLGREVWFHVAKKRFHEGHVDWLRRGQKTGNLPCHKSAKRGDLLLDYLGIPKSQIVAIHELTSDAQHNSNRNEEDYFPHRADIRRVATFLDKPLHKRLMESEGSLAGAFFLKLGGLQGYPRVTEYWPQLSDLVIRLNPKLAPKIKKFIS